MSSEARAAMSVSSYGALVETFLARGYEVRGYTDTRPDARHLILRHDIDISPVAGLVIAEKEADMNVAASYFVRMRSTLYNPYSPDNHAAICRIQALGHSIGLHFDAALYDDAGSLHAAAGQECQALESMLGHSVSMISFHRPAEFLLGLNENIAGRAHTYEARFFKDIGYCSDSRGDWYHGHPLDHEALAEGRAMQLLTHPVWWTNDPTIAVRRRLDTWLLERTNEMRRELEADIQTYGVKEIL